MDWYKSWLENIFLNTYLQTTSMKQITHRTRQKKLHAQCNSIHKIKNSQL
jgi:hypothetical protein